MDIRDWFIMVLFAIAWAVGTVYLFVHPSDVNFGTWQLFSAALIGAYKWLDIHDDKEPDKS